MVSMRSTLLLLAAAGARLVTAKTVLAHFMVQESYAYTVAEWKSDIAMAQQIGIDGFALNWIPPDCTSGLDWMVDRIDKAYSAASGTGFKLMHSFDMSYSSCDNNAFWNQTFMQSMITKYASNTAQLTWNGNILVSTFGGDTVSQYGESFFETLKSDLKSAGHSITLAPALTSYSEDAQADNGSSEAPAFLDSFPSADGFLNWQAWPTNGQNLTSLAVDQAFQSALKNQGRTGPYIMAVSPWQFKNQNGAGSSWVAYSDTLFHQRFQQLVTGSFNPDMIELLTWNDYGESHYLRPVPSNTNTSAPDYITYADSMDKYVVGANHNPWRIIAKYYISWWKNGKAPAITADQVVFWYRLHPKGLTCSQSGVTISGASYPVDAVFAWALVSSTATITVTVGANTRTFTADGTGPVVQMVPFPPGLSSVTPSVTITRNGKTVASASGSEPITGSCDWYNFNPVVTLCGAGVNV